MAPDFRSLTALSLLLSGFDIKVIEKYIFLFPSFPPPSLSHSLTFSPSKKVNSPETPKEKFMTATAPPDITTALQEIKKLLTPHSKRDRLIAKTMPRLAGLKKSPPHPLFSSLAPFLTPEVISYLGANPDGEINLLLLGARVDESGAFAYWQHILKHRHLLPKEVVFEVWFQCFNSSRFIFAMQTAETADHKHIITIPKSPADMEWLASLPLTDPLLLDNPIVSFRSSQAKKTGWKFLRHVKGRSWQPPRALNGKLLEAVKKDLMETFLIYLDMTGLTINYGMVMKIIKAKACNILNTLLKEKLISEFTLEELCVFCVSQLNDKEAIEVLDIIEKHSPGIIKNTRDDLGRNLLWYLLNNRHTIFFHPCCRLTPYLLAKGADPGNTNTLGLSWQFICDSMTREHKLSLLRTRSRAGQKLPDTMPMP